MAMLFEGAEPIVELVSAHFHRFDEDVIDRMNHKWSAVTLCLVGLAVTINTYCGEIIKCWTPANFPDSWIEYTNSYCWISNKYYVPMSELDILQAPRIEIVYYQWVPLMLFFQGLMFYAPSYLWSIGSRSVGLDINNVVKTLRQSENMNPDLRDKVTKFLIQHIDRSLNYTRLFRRGACTRLKHKMAIAGCFCGKRHGNYLVMVYLLTKIVYLSSSVLQMFLVQLFLGTNYTFYGFEVLRDLVMKNKYDESPKFPRVTLCDLDIRAVGETQPFSIQCALPVNLFNEKIYIFIWFWLVTMSVLNLIGFIYWVWIAFATNRRRFLKTHLRLFDKYDKNRDKELLNFFCQAYLRQDGYFMLRIVGKNTSQVVLGEIIKSLWDYYEQQLENQRKLNFLSV